MGDVFASVKYIFLASPEGKVDKKMKKSDHGVKEKEKKEVLKHVKEEVPSPEGTPSEHENAAKEKFHGRSHKRESPKNERMVEKSMISQRNYRSSSKHRHHSRSHRDTNKKDVLRGKHGAVAVSERESKRSRHH